MRLAVLLALGAALPPRCGGLLFKMDANGKQCISEDAGSDDVIVHATYNITSRPDPGCTVDLRVASTDDPDSGGAAKHHTKEVELESRQDVDAGTLTFVSDASEEFSVCFTSRCDRKTFGEVEILFDIRTGIDAKDYSSVAKQEHVGALEVELKKLEDEVKQIIDEMEYMRHREESMRNTNESTNARVLWFSVFSVVVLLSTAAWQVYHLKQYFKKKKLI